MKQQSARLTLGALVVALAVASPVVPQGRDTSNGLQHTITVTKFENRSGWRGYWHLGDAWATVMTDMLRQSGKFIVLGETDMRYEALAEQDLVETGRTAEGARSPATGELTPAQLLVKGTITHVQRTTTGGGGKVRIEGFRVGGHTDHAEVNATVYVIDSTTGQVVASHDVVASSKRLGGTFGYSGADFGGDVDLFKNDNVGKAVESAVSKSVDWIIAEIPNLPWSGSVALVKDGNVYINRGAREGVVAGQSFVVGLVDTVRDPETGEVLDESMTEIATIRVDLVKEKLAICSVDSGSLTSIERGMRVHLP